jgi:hypothetical protein
MLDSVFPIAVTFAKFPQVDDSVMQSHKIIPGRSSSEPRRAMTLSDRRTIEARI